MDGTKEENFFEEKMARLQDIVSALEADDLPLEKSMSLYKEGLACAHFCKERLEKARHELTVWQDGEIRPFALEKEAVDTAEECP
ncbi:MAG: exodeoxyribonuclease VII small subunit [Desulfovibrio sp.]|jgi:exodeoxyribonuclease VII small subunit|nr:exodeoxyribonuclease VII small subunit [Desulfovibrio sp.]